MNRFPGLCAGAMERGDLRFQYGFKRRKPCSPQTLAAYLKSTTSQEFTMLDSWLYALPRLIAFVLVILFLLALGPIGWILAIAYGAAVLKN